MQHPLIGAKVASQEDLAKSPSITYQQICTVMAMQRHNKMPAQVNTAPPLPLPTPQATYARVQEEGLLLHQVWQAQLQIQHGYKIGNLPACL